MCTRLPLWTIIPCITDISLSRTPLAHESYRAACHCRTVPVRSFPMLEHCLMPWTRDASANQMSANANIVLSRISWNWSTPTRRPATGARTHVIFAQRRPWTHSIHRALGSRYFVIDCSFAIPFVASHGRANLDILSGRRLSNVALNEPVCSGERRH